MPNDLRYPPRLRPGDRVGVFSPSSPGAARFPERLRQGVDALARGLGVEVIVPAGATRATGFTAGSARERAAALSELVADERIRAIFCTVGGFNSAEILPHLDAELLRRNPKVFVGYSDATALLVGVQALGGWVTFHGPAVLPQFGEHPAPFPFALRSLRAAVAEGEPLRAFEDPPAWTNEVLDWGTDAWRTRPRRMQTPADRAVWRPGTGRGRLFGGNLETLNLLVGTPFYHPPDDVVFFWEATREEAYLPRLRRALTHLRQSGLLHRTRAMLIGRSPYAAPVEGVSLRDVVLEATDGLDFPVVADLAFGHTDPMLTLPLGVPFCVQAAADGACAIYPCDAPDSAGAS
ncbi:MAG TPA: S66 peptidase family protein [Longimicrobium sp.]|nr:S66 peptidase family protein [Longimicrobium sp.]